MFEKLLAAQKEIGAIKRDSENPFFNSKYFDINAILREVKPILNKHGLVITQCLMGTDGGKNGINTTLYEASTGERIESHCYLPEGLDPQKTGSAITYFRRYAIQSMLALEAEDDDANLASGKKVAYKSNAKPQKFDGEPF